MKIMSRLATAFLFAVCFNRIYIWCMDCNYISTVITFMWAPLCDYVLLITRKTTYIDRVKHDIILVLTSTYYTSQE